MSYQALEFVARLPADTPAEKSVKFALAKEHNYRTGKMLSSERRLAKIASVSPRHTHTCLAKAERRGEIRRTRGKNRNDLSSFEFVNFHFIPRDDASVLKSRAEVASTPRAEVASARNKEERKIKVNQTPLTPLFQRGDDAPLDRRKLTSRDIRELLKVIDSIYAAGVGRAIEFREAFEKACVECLMHPDDARRAIGLTKELDWDRKRPPERAAG